MKTTINDVANYILHEFQVHGDCISNKKLQKLLYYVQAWHLALHGESVFDEKFQAWVHGPVAPIVYRRFKDFGFKSIDEKMEKPILPQTLTYHIDEVLDEYMQYNAWELELMTHDEEPWIEARKGLANNVQSQNEISEETMQQYYSNL